MSTSFTTQCRASLAFTHAAEALLNTARRLQGRPAIEWKDASVPEQQRALSATRSALAELGQPRQAGWLRLAESLIVLEDFNRGRTEARNFASLTDSAKAHYLRCARQLVSAYHAGLDGTQPLSEGERAMLARLEERQRLSPSQRLAHDGIVDQLKETLREALR